jgi:F0F1-type ATP synthase assembly protein I
MANHSGTPVTTFQALAVASQFGITLAVAVVLGFFAGQWLDGRLNTGIVFTLIGVLIGLIAATVNTVRVYRTIFDGRGSGGHAQTTASAHQADDGPTEEE